ncbi:NAD(P)H-dependent oxidoreductase subunit E [Anaeroselena agilis]|uniref:NAD(P)H-dependent oxidoreductase subunit E n=1 Tax=Anaeroselena agilis TaxID=3063788 RepID=A0ABU3NVZ7_9FIRM|nr:NAD(P)H-dependent oxidoreductase subunit E [Selenomonadales bacterium 4137-cl]
MSTLRIEVCLGTSCHLMGAQDIIDAIENLPPDKRSKIDLRGVTCLKTCRKGPNARVNGIILSEITPERILTVIEDNLA